MSLSTLPGDLVAYFVTSLDLRSVGRLAAMCKHLHHFTTGDPYVVTLMQARLGAEECTLRGPSGLP